MNGWCTEAALKERFALLVQIWPQGWALSGGSV